MKVLVTGGYGYLGSVLLPKLVERGHEVTVLDQCIFGQHIAGPWRSVVGDILTAPPREWVMHSEDGTGYDAVIHLAGLSNDPMADFAPSENFRVNALGTEYVARMTAAWGQPRFIYASTCSVYGHRPATWPLCHEDEPLMGFSNYAASKYLGELAVKHYAPQHVIFRMGTIIGPSPRMRWDLAVHPMIKTGLQEGVVRVFDKSSWRPMVDVRDVAEAYCAALEDPTVQGTFNLATENYPVSTVGLAVWRILQAYGHEATLELGEAEDVRSYRVMLNNRFSLNCQVPLRKTILDVLDLATPESLNDPLNNNIATYRTWLATG